MTTVSAATPVRLVLATAFLAASLAVVLVGRAEGAEQAWAGYLAPSGACHGATEPGAPAAVQRRAIRCLVNWARARERRPGLRPSAALQRAAALKGRDVASCRELSHGPCRSSVTDAVRRAGYRYATFGENLFVGAGRHVSARDVVLAWLQSPSHRANILRPWFRDLGLAAVSAPGFLGDGDSVVWVAAFASPK